MRASDSSSIEAFLSTSRPAARNPNNNGDSVEPGCLPSAVGANVTNGNNPETGDWASGFVTAVILAATGFCKPGAASVTGATSTGGLVDCVSAGPGSFGAMLRAGACDRALRLVSVTVFAVDWVVVVVDGGATDTTFCFKADRFFGGSASSSFCLDFAPALPGDVDVIGPPELPTCIPPAESSAPSTSPESPASPTPPRRRSRRDLRHRPLYRTDPPPNHPDSSAPTPPARPTDPAHPRCLPKPLPAPRRSPRRSPTRPPTPLPARHTVQSSSQYLPLNAGN